MNKREAMRIHGVLLKEAERLRPGNRKITHKEALMVVTQDELDYALKAQNIFNGILFERRSRGARYYCL